MKLRTEKEIMDVRTRVAIIEDISVGKESKARKAEHTKRAEVYNDRTREYVLRNIKEEMGNSTALEMLHRTPNISITKKVVDKKARVYKDRPVRKADKVKPGKVLEAFADYIGLDAFMKKVNKKVELHLNVLVKALPVKSVDEEGFWDLRLGILTPQNFDVIEDPDDPTRPMVIILSYARHDAMFLSDYRAGDSVDNTIAEPSASEAKVASIGKEAVYVWWSKSFHFITDEKGVLQAGSPEGGVNELGFLPFESFAKGQDGRFWVDGGEGLADNAILINHLIADMNYSAKYQSVGIGYVTGKSVPKEIQMGPNRFITIEQEEGQPEPKVGFATPNPKLEENLNIIEQELAFFLTSEGLEPGAISGRLEGASAQSGIQEIIQKSEPSTAIEDDQQLYKDTEPRLVRLSARVVADLRDRGVLCKELEEVGDLPIDIDYALTFERPKPFMTDKELIEIIEARQRTGLFTEQELLQELHPDWDEKMIEEQLAKLKEMKATKLKDQQALIPGLNKDKVLEPGKEEEDEDALESKPGDKNTKS